MNITTQMSLTKIQSIGNRFRSMNFIDKTFNNLTKQDFTKILFAYKNSNIFMEATLFRFTEGKIEQMRNTENFEIFGFEVTDVFEEELNDSIGGTLHVFNNVEPYDKNRPDDVYVTKSYNNVLFEWDNSIKTWKTKYGLDNNELYLYLPTVPMMSYHLYKLG